VITFSKDVDLLKWEPGLFRDLIFPSQVLCQGVEGVINGSNFTCAEATFISHQVKAGQVITLQDQDGTIDGSYEIVAVDSETQLTISVVRVSGENAVIAPTAGTEITYRICTFAPQAEEAGYSLAQYFGLDVEGDSEQIGPDDIVNARSLRQCSVFSVLSVVFASYAIGAKDPGGYWEKSHRYQKMFEKARVKARLCIDADGDAQGDSARVGGMVRLRRL
jgi:hypothetical protein